MTINAGNVLRQAAALAAEKKINLTFRMDSRKLHVTSFEPRKPRPSGRGGFGACSDHADFLLPPTDFPDHP